MAFDRTSGDVAALATRYVRQEILDPLRTVGRFLAFGVVGAALIGVGVILLGVGGLRLLQRWSVLEGSWSWAPYLVVAMFLAGFTVLAGSRIVRSSQLDPENGPS